MLCLLKQYLGENCFSFTAQLWYSKSFLLTAFSSEDFTQITFTNVNRRQYPGAYQWIKRMFPVHTDSLQINKEL